MGFEILYFMREIQMRMINESIVIFENIYTFKPTMHFTLLCVESFRRHAVFTVLPTQVLHPYS
jgi:hypothetical protein